MDLLAFITVFLIFCGLMIVICFMDDKIKELNNEKECLKNCGVGCPRKCVYLDENDYCLHFACQCQKLAEKNDIID